MTTQKFHTGFEEGCRQVASDTRSKFFLAAGPTQEEHSRFLAPDKGCEPTQKLHRFGHLQRVCLCGAEEVSPPIHRTSVQYKRALKQYVQTGEK